MADTITPILDKLPSQRPLATPIQAVPQSLIEAVVGDNVAGVEVSLQVLIGIAGTLARDARQDEADRKSGAVRKFFNAPVTYDGFGNGRRRPPPDVILLVV